MVEKLAARGVSRNVLSQLEEIGQEVFKTNQQTWNSCQDTISLLHSVGKAVQGCVNNCVFNVATSMISRRDVWLEEFKDVLPKQELLQLRAADLNTDKLFGREALEVAMDKAKSEKKVKVQDSILASHSASKGVGQSKNKGGFQRQPFRQQQPQATQSKPQAQPAQNNSGRGGQAYQGRGRGGKGSGGYNRGRGRGNFTKTT